MKTSDHKIWITSLLILSLTFLNNRSDAQSLSAGSNTAICLGSSTTLTATDGSGYVWEPATGLSCTTCASTIATPSVTTTYTVSSTVMGIPVASATVTVSVNPVPSGIMGSIAICLGQYSTLSNAFTDGTWTSSNAHVTIDEWGGATGVSAGTATITYALPSGCKSTAVMTVDAASAITGSTAIYPSTTTTLSCGAGDGTWSCSNANVTIEASGLVTGNTAGTTMITYTSPGGCESNIVVTVSSTPAPLTGTATVCVGKTTTFSSLSADGTWSSSNTAKATVDAGGEITGISSGTAAITYAIASGYVTKNVYISTTPDDITGIANICEGSYTVLYSTIGGSGTWTSSDTTIATINTTSGMMAGVSEGSATITCKVASSGCYKTQVVNIYTTPVDIWGDGDLCAGSVATFTNTTTGGTWTTNNTTVATVGATSGIVTGITAGGATLSYTTSNGCYKTMPLTINTIPANITGTLSVCTEASTTLSNTTTGGTWYSGNTDVATIGSTSGIVTSATAGTAGITYTNAAGCVRATILTVNTVPGTATGYSTVCIGSTTNWTNATTGGTWTTSNASIATIGAATGSITAIGTGTAKITYTLSGAGCLSVREVSVIGAPENITGSTSICAGTNTTLAHTSTGGTWSSSNTSIASIDASTGVMTGVSAGVATITYRLNAGCIKTIAVTIKALPTAISGTTTLCAGSATTLGSSPAGGTWYSSIPARATINASNGTVLGVSTGTTTISYVSGGCTITKVATVDAALPAITGLITICPGTSSTLTNATSGGTWTSSNTSKATINSTTGIVNGISSGTSNITYLTTPTCYTTGQVTVSSTIAAITGTPSVCVDNTTTLNHITSGGTWTSSNTAKATITSGGVVSGISAGSTTITYATGGSCYTTINVNVYALPAPITGNINICKGAASILTSTIGGSGTWCSSNTSIATANSTSGMVTGIAEGNAIITYKIPSTGCYTTKQITINAAPSVITGSSSICTGNSCTLTDSVSGGTWASSAPTVVSINITTGALNALTAGAGTITYKLANGCSKTLAMTIKANPAAIAGASTVAVGTSVTLTNATAGGTWASSNADNATIGTASGIVSGVTAGTSIISYKVTTSGCYVTRTMSVNSVAGKQVYNASTIPAPASFNLYPNPTSGILNIIAQAGGLLKIYSMDGKIAAQFAITETTSTISLPGNLVAGSYICRFTGLDGSTATAQIIYNP